MFYRIKAFTIKSPHLYPIKQKNRPFCKRTKVYWRSLYHLLHCTGCFCRYKNPLTGISVSPYLPVCPSELQLRSDIRRIYSLPGSHLPRFAVRFRLQLLSPSTFLWLCFFTLCGFIIRSGISLCQVFFGIFKVILTRRNQKFLHTSCK